MIYELDDTNYEDMDDLALLDHIEWNHAQSEQFSMDAIDSAEDCSLQFD